MASKKFSHLHVHTEYSILDGIIRIDELMEWTKKNGNDYVAITDHGNLHGAVCFYKAATAADLKPVIGIETYVAPTHRTDRNLNKDESNNHLVLFVADATGYQNLIKLSSLAYTEGFYYKPRIDLEILREFNEGLISTTACLQGRVNRLLTYGQIEEARKSFEELLDIFSKDRLFIEYMYHGIPQQKQIRPFLENLSDEYNVPIIATNDAHYVKKSDAQYQDVSMCIQTNKKVFDQGRIKFPTDEFYLKTYDEMLKVVEGNAEWLRNCDLVANQIDFKMEMDVFHFPQFETPDKSSPGEFLMNLSQEGLKKRFKGEDIPKEYKQRLDYEIGLIDKLGFSSYFLIIDDFVKFALSNNISKGPGRGSGAGSLVSYALGITDIDPIEYVLLFERFISPARKSMPDMDLDFDRREEVIEYVREKYGDDYVCNIVTFNRMKSRAAVRDVARVLDIPLQMADKVSKMIPSGMKISEAMEINKELGDMYKNDVQVRKWLNTAQAIEGLVRNIGIHPAGVIIADKPVIEYAPLMVAEKSTSRVCQFPMDDVDAIGLIKMDFLGLRTLAYMKDCIELIKENHGIEVKPSDIPLDDKKTYRLMSNMDTLGVFQLESAGMRSLMAEIRPDRITDVVALIALYRPGPMKHAPRFVARKHKKEIINYPHPDMKPILDDTYGVITYQEQITIILVELAGIDLVDAVSIIKIISKKRSEEEINKFRDQFVEGTARKNIDKNTANAIFDSIVEFAGYGFNRSHSAAYAMLAYWTAYLKANYPLEFYCAFLTSEMHDTEKITEILREIKQNKIDLNIPDINKSVAGFSVEGKSIRFGLQAIKGVGNQAVVSIINARDKKGDFKDLLDFISRVDPQAVNRSTVENLIKSGAMDNLPGSRAQKVEAIDRVLEIGKQAHDDRVKGQEQLFSLSGNDTETDAIAFKPMDDFPNEQKLRMEKQLTGFFLSGHPLDRFWKNITKNTTHTIQELATLGNNQNVTVGGLVTSLEFKISRKLEEYASFKLEDLTGSVDVMVFPRSLQDGNKPELVPDAVLMMTGRIKVETSESQTDDGETIDTHKVSLILEKAKKISSPTDIKSISKEDKDAEANKSIKQSVSTLHLNYEIELTSEIVEKADLILGLPMDKERIKSIGSILRETIVENRGDTRLDVVFQIGESKLRVDLGLKGGCNYYEIKRLLGNEISGVRWNP